MLRREFLAGLLAVAAAPQTTTAQETISHPELGAPKPFSPEMVVDLARKLSRQAYQAPRKIPEEWLKLNYDQYNSMWFNGHKALWNKRPELPLRVDFFAPGLYFPHPVQISVVEAGMAKPVSFDLGLFDKTDKFPELPIDESLGYSGLRLRAELEKPGIYQEFAVFQGASYFRAIGTGEIYGISARGLAIDTAEPKGEEFPEFRSFWIEKPAPGNSYYRIHALLDSPSCSGVYRFEVMPGHPLVMDVEAQLFPRKDCNNVGIAPLTSMFLFNGTNRERFSDFRPAVHDSDGLLIVNGAGESLWRPLANPKKLQVSLFVDNNPKGFGLMQRARHFRDFADLEALYHRRPGVWIEPQGDWGKGFVSLVEIPSDREIYDNIVSYWRPAEGLSKGNEYKFSYRMTWGQKGEYGEGLPVLQTRMGESFDKKGIVIAIDFADGPNVPKDLDRIEKVIRASSGTVSEGVLQRNPETGGPRLAFKFIPGDAKLIEFRAELRLNNAPLSETWLYRWTV